MRNISEKLSHGLSLGVEESKSDEKSQGNSALKVSDMPYVGSSFSKRIYPMGDSFPSSGKNISHKMSDLIPVINRLQDVFSSIGHEHLDLPQIVVVGSQSSGKSSVLENIVQKDFLPRGTDIVTRRPLILQLVQISAESQHEYAEFLHRPGKKYFDFNEVRLEIDKETNRIAGGKKGISDVPINLRIYSPNVLNLTLVDLPGITKIPVQDQPADIEAQIRRLVVRYVSNPNSIILAVTPANQDIVNSEALKLAREIDSSGKRTIGVLTKLDLMDAGTDATEILDGNAFTLHLGFIGVVNRSQKDIMEHKQIKQALESEEKFFRTHPAYSRIADKCGTKYLAKTLNSLLIHHIRDKLPELKAKLNLLIVQTEQELQSYGDQAFVGKAHQGSLVLKLLTKFATNFNASIDGTFDDVTTSELSGGARLYYIFNSIFGETLASIDPCASLTMQDIRNAIRNSTGPRPSLFIPEMAFDLLIKPQIKRLEIPGLRCVELVFDELLKIVTGCETKELRRFPKLSQKIQEVCVELLRERMAPTQAYIESLISIQMAYINTNHPDFIGGNSAISMLERKYEKRRREMERFRRSQMLAMSSGSIVNNSAPSAKASNSSERNRNMKTASESKDPSQQASMKQIEISGKDGGFLNYFFGNNPNADFPDHISGSEYGSNSSTSQIRKDSGQEDKNLYQNFQSEFSRPPPSGRFSSVDREDIEVELIRSLMYSYFNIVRKGVADMVPKTIMYLIVNYAKENIQNRLVSSLYKEELFEEILQEDERVMNDRKKCKALLDTYRRGAALLQDIF